MGLVSAVFVVAIKTTIPLCFGFQNESASRSQWRGHGIINVLIPPPCDECVMTFLVLKVQCKCVCSKEITFLPHIHLISVEMSS